MKTKRAMRSAIAVFSILGMLSALPALARNHDFGIGFQLGLNYSHPSTKAPASTITFDPKLGVMVGAVGDIAILDFLSLQPEVIYVQKSGKIENSLGFDTDADRSYLDVPVLAKLAFPAGSVTPFLLLGPSVGFNLSAKNTVAPSSGVGASFTTDVKNNTSSLSWEGILGGGVEIPISGTKQVATATLRYALGLNDIDKSGSEWKHRGLQLLAGYQIRF